MSVEAKVNKSIAPYPKELEELVAGLRYRPGWSFRLAHEQHSSGQAEGLVFSVYSLGFDTYHPDRGETYRVHHAFLVPPATFDRRAWERWLLDRLVELETHEACEFLRFEEPALDGGPGLPSSVERRPFAPNHGPGRNPYSIVEVGTLADAETRFTGEHKPGSQPS